MKFERLCNVHTPSIIKKNKTFIIIVLIFLAVYSSFLQVFNQHERKKLCPSAYHYINAEYYKHSSQIQLIPSCVETSPAERTRQNECVSISHSNQGFSVIICIHNPEQDLKISKHLKTKGSWERENVASMLHARTIYPDIMLVDLGSNLGVFTLPAAKIGMEVIALDAMLSSLKLLRRSLLLNDLTCQVTLVHNAVSNSHKQMEVKLQPTNIGGSKVQEIKESDNGKLENSEVVDAICLDALVPLASGRDVFLKLDLEGSELDVLQCANNFFNQVNVKVILLEWTFYRDDPTRSDAIKDFLISQGFLPTYGVDPDKIIDIAASHQWPDEVYWMRLAGKLV